MFVSNAVGSTPTDIFLAQNNVTQSQIITSTVDLVPESPSLALLTSGLACLGVAATRRRT